MPRGKPFAKGADPRRHVLTREEASKGRATQFWLWWYEQCGRLDVIRQQWPKLYRRRYLDTGRHKR